MVSNEDALTEEIKRLISKHTGCAVRDIDSETQLGADLGLDGVDAWDLLVDYEQQFDVDMSKFDFYNYFGPETTSGFWYKWWQRKHRKLNKKTPNPLLKMTVQDLLDSAVAGKWIDP